MYEFPEIENMPMDTVFAGRIEPNYIKTRRKQWK